MSLKNFCCKKRIKVTNLVDYINILKGVSTPGAFATPGSIAGYPPVKNLSATPIHRETKTQAEKGLKAEAMNKRMKVNNINRAMPIFSITN